MWKYVATFNVVVAILGVIATGFLCCITRLFRNDTHAPAFNLFVFKVRTLIACCAYKADKVFMKHVKCNWLSSINT